MDSVLYCSGITKSYGKKIALEDVNLDVPKGSIVGLLGPNGSGKTTLLKIAAGLLTPTKGEIKICGLEPGAKSKNLLAYQPDKVYLNDWMNVADLFKMMEDFYSNFDMAKEKDMLKRLEINEKDKLKTMEAVENTNENKEVKQAIQDDNKITEAISALQVLGYNRKEIEKVLEKLDKDEMSLEDIIRKSLTMLGR